MLRYQNLRPRNIEDVCCEQTFSHGSEEYVPGPHYRVKRIPRVCRDGQDGGEQDQECLGYRRRLTHESWERSWFLPIGRH